MLWGICGGRASLRKGFWAEARRKRTIFVTIRGEEIPDRGQSLCKDSVAEERLVWERSGMAGVVTQ